jgi:sec-independent protein translocase protein TatC
LSLIEHFEELRKRLIIAISAWVVGAVVAFYFRSELLAWLSAPLPGHLQLTVFSFIEPFVVSMQISAFFGLILASPVIVGQVWGFIAPGLYPAERRWAVPFVLFTALAFATGVLFSRYVVMPIIIPMLLAFLGDAVTATLSTRIYISQLLVYMGLLGAVFEMPVLAFLLARIGLLRAEFLSRYRRHAVVVNLVLAAGITPTGDPLSLALVGVPLILLYEISIVVVRISQQRVEDARANPEFT